MRSHRIFAWICVLTFLTLALAGCAPAAPTQPAGEAAPAAESSTESSAGSSGAAAGDEKITLEIWDTGTEYYQWVEDVAIPMFKEKHPNVEIVHTGIPYDQYTLKIDTAATAGDLPDLIADEVLGPNAKWYKAGLFIPLNEYMDRDGIKQKDYCGLLYFTEGKTAISYGDMSMATQAADKGIDVGINGQPVITKDWPMNTHIYGMGDNVTKASKHPHLAYEFAKMTSTEIPLKWRITSPRARARS